MSFLREKNIVRLIIGNLGKFEYPRVGNDVG